jgi:hypothetical protein
MHKPGGSYRTKGVGLKGKRLDKPAFSRIKHREAEVFRSVESLWIMVERLRIPQRERLI